jgi:hypothetical protein
VGLSEKNLLIAVLRIRDPTFSIPDPRSRVNKILDPDLHQRIEVFLTKKLILSSQKDVHPGSWMIWTFSVPDPGFRGQKSIGSRIRIVNTV